MRSLVCAPISTHTLYFKRKIINHINLTMRFKVSSRKTTGALFPKKQYDNYEKMKLLVQRQKEMAEKVRISASCMPSETSITSNVDEQSMKVVQITPANEVLNGKDKLIIVPAVRQNNPIRFQHFPVKVVPNAFSDNQGSQKMQDTTWLRTNLTATAFEQAAEKNHDCTQPDSSSPGKEMSINGTTNSAENFLDKSSISQVSEEKTTRSKGVKRKESPSIASTSSQSEAPDKKKVKKEETSCKRFIEKHDKSILLHQLSKEVDLEEMLKVYKENRSKEEVEQEAVRVLELQSRNDSTNPAIVSTLKNCLEGFSKLFVNDDFEETILKIISRGLKASKALDILNQDDLKVAVIEKFTAIGLLNSFSENDRSLVRGELLKTVSVDEVVNLVRSRNDLNTSEPLLNVFLECFSQIVPGEPNSNHENTVKSESETVLISALGNVIKSRKYLKSSECLLNIMLKNGPERLSNETKKIVTNILLQKFNRQDFANLFKEVLVPKEQVIEID